MWCEGALVTSVFGVVVLSFVICFGYRVTCRLLMWGCGLSYIFVTHVGVMWSSPVWCSRGRAKLVMDGSG